MSIDSQILTKSEYKILKQEVIELVKQAQATLSCMIPDEFKVQELEETDKEFGVVYLWVTAIDIHWNICNEYTWDVRTGVKWYRSQDTKVVVPYNGMLFFGENGNKYWTVRLERPLIFKEPWSYIIELTSSSLEFIKTSYEIVIWE